LTEYYELNILFLRRIEFNYFIQITLYRDTYYWYKYCLLKDAKEVRLNNEKINLYINSKHYGHLYNFIYDEKY